MHAQSHPRSHPAGRRGIALSPALAVALLFGPAIGTTVAATYSSPIAITANDQFVWVVNPDNDSVSVLEVGGGLNLKRAELKVGVNPRSLAITPNGQKVYVTNMASGSVTVIDAATRKATRVIPVGREPFGCALSPDGAKLYVANFSSDSLSIIDVATDAVTQTVSNIAIKPRGIAVTSDAMGNRVFITHFLAQPASAMSVEGRDDGKQGRVTFFHDAAVQTTAVIPLNPIADTGFSSNGSVLDRIAPTDPATFTFVTGAFPNLLQSIVIKGNRAYVPNTGSSPNGPVRFNVNLQGLLASVDLTTNTDAGETLNLNRGVQFEPVGTRLFNTNPIAIAFKSGADEGFAVLAATNRLVRVQLDADGTPTINAPASDMAPSGIVRIPVGKNPQGIALNSSDTRAYVMNYISRDVSVVDIGGPSATQFTEIARIASAGLPAAGTQAAIVHRGHELFNTSVGPAGTQPNSTPPAGRMSDFGWGSCYGCHPDGLTDGVTWMFGAGPRQTISMESTAEHPQPPGSMLNANGAPLLPAFKQRVLNWSAERDEIQDFELNIRGVSGGEGLITDGQPVVNLVPTANTGRSADLDAIAAYVAFGIRAPISPARPTNVGGASPDIEVAQGRALFAAANCQSCHGGPSWTRSQVSFTPPPTAGAITTGQLTASLVQVGTFDPTAFNEVRPVGTTIVTALGADGFNVPSLVSVFAGAPYLHNGAAPLPADVLLNVTHRSAGTGGVDTLTNAADRAKLVKFLLSIDATTPTFP